MPETYFCQFEHGVYKLDPVLSGQDNDECDHEPDEEEYSYYEKDGVVGGDVGRLELLVDEGEVVSEVAVDEADSQQHHHHEHDRNEEVGCDCGDDVGGDDHHQAQNYADGPAGHDVIKRVVGREEGQGAAVVQEQDLHRAAADVAVVSR